MQKRGITEIALLILGLILGCCWLPRGISGLLTLTRVVSPGLWLPNKLWQLAQIWADPLTWYGQQVFQRFPRLGPRVLAFLTAVPNCLCGIVAILVIALAVFLFIRAAGVERKETPQ